MNATRLAPLHDAAAAPLPGTWKLAAGRAITLQPLQRGTLKVAHGRLWATFDGPHGIHPDDAGDLVVEVGEAVTIAPGQRVVIESWGRGRTAYFSWDPVAEVAVARGLAWGEMVQPLADLRRATGLVVQAAARVVTVLVRVAADAVLPRKPIPAGVCRT
ncbi:DUF2917 domain-containing protein [Ramlibacter sp.]|uniref:DUF2917 domain-containing protein n=1 Tax=Ramlibacter sp. TaxID=1917967 RepID=UPI003D0A6598